MKNIFNLAILIIISSFSLIAQNYKLSGSVFDSLTNQPLVGANVALESTYETGNIKGTTTDANGNFTIELSPASYKLSSSSATKTG